MSNFHWTNLISLNSSQNDAFEELLCQLAKKEPILNKKEFIKVGNPDGGVECYVVLENDDEIGFQAKWFNSTPQETQWNQVEHSYKIALEKHPKLATYYIAIPLDRADPRKDNQQWFMDKWNEKVKKWKKFALDTYGKQVEIVYWGSSEFIERLVKEENVGLKKFFFNEIDLSDKWIQDKNKLAIADLGARYTPEINVELEIVENFNAISRNNTFKEQVDTIYHEFMVNFRKLLNRHKIDEKLIQNFDELNKRLIDFEEEYFKINLMGIEEINFSIFEIYINNIELISNKISESLEELNEKEIKEKNIKTE